MTVKRNLADGAVHDFLVRLRPGCFVSPTVVAEVLKCREQRSDHRGEHHLGCGLGVSKDQVLGDARALGDVLDRRSAAATLGE